MSFSLNKIQLIDNLGQDAEHRFTTNNKGVSNFSIATVNSYKGKDGNWVNETTWHNVVAWELSDFLKERLVKGSKWYVEGRLAKREYEKEGVKKYITEVVVGFAGLIPLSDSQPDASNAPHTGNTATPQTTTETPSSAVSAQGDDPSRELPF